MKRMIFYCETCGDQSDYCGKYDTFFCCRCDAWRERQCPPEEACSFCMGRPEKPSDAAKVA